MNSVPPLPRRTWLARLLRRLGFRWIFPFGTFPVPYRPLLVRLLPIALGEQARPLIIGIGELNNWPEPLRLAREMLDTGQMIDLASVK